MRFLGQRPRVAGNQPSKWSYKLPSEPTGVLGRGVSSVCEMWAGCEGGKGHPVSSVAPGLWTLGAPGSCGL